MEITDQDRLDFLEKYIFTNSSIIPHIMFNYEVHPNDDERNINKYPICLCIDYEEKNKLYFGRSIREAIDNAIITMGDINNE